MTATVGSEVAAAGDEVARLYDRYAPKLRRFCLGRLRSPEDADDAVQTVFLRVYTALRGGTAPVYEAAWLYKIAHNVCLSRLESGAARARVERPHDLGALQDVLAVPGDRRDELVGLAEALAAMPPNLRQAILLREWQGLSYAEIAEALGVSVSAVETLIFRARRHLAAALERGVTAPARSVAALLELPWLLRRLRTLLASGRGAELGSAKLTATAVVAAAVAGGGVATGVLASRGAAPAPIIRPSVPGTGSTAVVAAARTTIARAVPVAAAPRRRSATHVVGAGPGGAPTPAASAAAMPPSPTGVAVTTTASPTVTVPTVSTPVDLPTAPTPTVAVPTVTLPTATVPTAATPTAPIPTVPIQTVPIQTVPIPTVPIPTVPIPTASVPVLTTPTVSLPVGTLPATTVALPPPPLP